MSVWDDTAQEFEVQILFYTLTLHATVLGHVTSGSPFFSFVKWDAWIGNLYCPLWTLISSLNTIYQILVHLWEHLGYVLPIYPCIHIYYIDNIYIYINLTWFYMSLYFKSLFKLIFYGPLALEGRWGCLCYKNILFAHSSQAQHAICKWGMMVFCYEMPLDVGQPQSNDFQIYFSLL